MSSDRCRCSEEDVLAFVIGDLEGPDDLAVAEHLAECAGCRDVAVDVRALEEAVSDGCSNAALAWDRFESPFGSMRVAATSRGIAWLTWRHEDDDAFVEEAQERFREQVVLRRPRRLEEAVSQLREYFQGRRDHFDVDVDLSRLTDFQRRVLRAARTLGHGEVVPYGELARRIGRPRASRAVGGALGRNPVPIVVPCHRVVRKDGSLGGYGAGVEYKERLLRVEGRDDLARAG